MSYYGSTEWLVRVANGEVPNWSVVNKFGQGAVGTSFTPVTSSTVYQTPTSATALEVVSSDANDTAAGSGAREITLVGLNSSWAEVTQTVATSGATAAAVTTNLIRLYRAYVSSSGTYGTASSASHAGTITVRVASAGATWATIPIVNSFPVGQTLIGAYTIPLNYTAYLLNYTISVDASKSTNVMLFQRPNANDVTTAYSGAIRSVDFHVGLTQTFAKYSRIPTGPFVGPCDIGFMGYVAASTADVAVDFDLLLNYTG